MSKLENSAMEIRPSANDRQVGGDHYKTGGIELWDLFGPEALVFYALRYVSRWRCKGGVEDLNKCLHCVEKLLEIAPQWFMPSFTLRLAVSDDLVRAWIASSDMDWTERHIADILLHLRNEDNICDAIGGIRHLIETNKPSGEPPPTRVAAKPSFTTERGTFEIDELCHYAAAADNSPPLLARIIDFYHDGDAVISLGYEGHKTVKWGTLSKRREPLVPRREKQKPWTLAEARLQPWQIDRATFKAQSAGSAVAHAAMRAFYKQVAMDIYRLEPWVEGNCPLPSAVHDCYEVLNGAARLLRIDLVPRELRDCYPSLREGVSSTELAELPEWQRELYEWSGSHGRYQLADVHRAWHVEEEEKS